MTANTMNTTITMLNVLCYACVLLTCLIIFPGKFVPQLNTDDIGYRPSFVIVNNPCRLEPSDRLVLEIRADVS